ncbi:MAG: UDP-N-acetylmuramoyl-L-alanine--D-glutamate ligase [Lachnospirales bacterium]
MDIKNKKVLVCGLGKTGFGVLPLLLKLGCTVTIQTPSVSQEYNDALEKYIDMGVSLFINNTPNDIIKNFDLVVVSPGISSDLPFFKLAKDSDIEIISEVELANMFFKGRLIGITGTNGKTTTTTLVGEIIKEVFIDTEVVGNIGVPFSEKVLDSEETSVFAIELSSYQLEKTFTLKPKTATILNVTPDHLERHKTMQNYISCKERIFENQDNSDYLILNYDNKESYDMVSKAKSNIVLFSKEPISEDGLKVYVKDEKIYTNFLKKSTKDNDLVERLQEDKKIINLSDITLLGEHNIENILASIALTLPLGVSVEVLEDVISHFKGVEHRLEFIKIIHGVTFINDSKATNPDSSINAIKSINQPIILIVGGYDKNLPIFEFVKEITKKVKHLIIIGETKDKFVNSCLKIGYTDFTVCESLESAALEGFKVAKPGDCVLLSPSCSSYDMFDNFEHRGKVFKEAIHKLRG